jgi:hypothetical protein
MRTLLMRQGSSVSRNRDEPQVPPNVQDEQPGKLARALLFSLQGE